MSDKNYFPMIPFIDDTTKYRLITTDYIETMEFSGREILKIDPEGISVLTAKGFSDTSHLLRTQHLEQLRKILDDPEARAFASAVMDEASRIGAAIGCPIEQTADDRHEVTRKLGAFKTSMLQDAEAGKQLEIGALLEAPQEIARLAGIDTPSLDHLLGVMRVFNKSRTGH